jgi:hypothetical protein
MTRNDLITRLVARKMAHGRTIQALCGYGAGPARKICFAAKLCVVAAQPSAPARKKD